jgi:hypothetical protein
MRVAEAGEGETGRATTIRLHRGAYYVPHARAAFGLGDAYDLSV